MPWTTYGTQDEFAAYLHRVLDRDGFATDLGWSVGDGSYDDVTNDALASAGVTDITSVTSVTAIRRLNAAGRLALWQQVVDASVHLRDNRTSDGSSAAMSQIHAQAVQMLARAEEEAVRLGVVVEGYVVGITNIPYRHDPYAAWEVDP